MDPGKSGGQPQPDGVPDGAWQALLALHGGKHLLLSNIGVYLENRGNGDPDLFSDVY